MNLSQTPCPFELAPRTARSHGFSAKNRRRKNRRKTSTSISPRVFVFQTAVSLNRAQRGPRRGSVSRRARRESRRSEGTEQDQYGDSETRRSTSWPWREGRSGQPV